MILSAPQAHIASPIKQEAVPKNTLYYFQLLTEVYLAVAFILFCFVWRGFFVQISFRLSFDLTVCFNATVNADSIPNLFIDDDTMH